MVDRFGINMMPTGMILRGLKTLYKKGGQWLEADHIISAVERPDLAEKLSNYRCLCNKCHYKKTNEAEGRFR